METVIDQTRQLILFLNLVVLDGRLIANLVLIVRGGKSIRFLMNLTRILSLLNLSGFLLLFDTDVA